MLPSLCMSGSLYDVHKVITMVLDSFLFPAHVAGTPVKRGKLEPIIQDRYVDIIYTIYHQPWLSVDLPLYATTLGDHLN